MKDLKLTYFCFALTLFFMKANALYAQSQECVSETHSYWINLGIGGGTFEGVISANVSYQFKRNILSIRGVETGEWYGNNGMWDIGILYGLATNPSHTQAAVGIGVALVGGKSEESLLPDNAIKKRIGLPIELQLFFRPIRFVGMGLYGFANINSEKSFVGVSLSLQFGKLR
jgi:hypothetical protein